MKKLANLFKRNTLEKVYIRRSHRMVNAELVNTGFGCTSYIRF